MYKYSILSTNFQENRRNSGINPPTGLYGTEKSLVLRVLTSHVYNIFWPTIKYRCKVDKYKKEYKKETKSVYVLIYSYFICRKFTWVSQK